MNNNNNTIATNKRKATSTSTKAASKRKKVEKEEEEDEESGDEDAEVPEDAESMTVAQLKAELEKVIPPYIRFPRFFRQFVLKSLISSTARIDNERQEGGPGEADGCKAGEGERPQL